MKLLPISPYVVDRPVEESSSIVSNHNRMSPDDEERLPDPRSLKVRRPDGAIVAQRMREQFVARATLALSRAPDGLNAPMVEKDRSDLGGDGERNKQAALDALEAIQLALYDREYSQTIKSSNKWPLRHGEPRRIGSGPMPPTLQLFEDDPAKAASRSIDIWQSSYINCAALAAAAQDYLMHERPEVQTTTLLLEERHALALVGTVENSFAWRLLPDWPRHVHVCDPWANLTCPAPDYPKRLVEKLTKWASDGKKLRLEGHWISPLDERWTSCALSGNRIVFTRRHFTDGQFLERRVVTVSQ